MLKQILTLFVFTALSAASAATFSVSLIQPIVLNGKALKAGDYQFELKENSVAVLKGKKLQVEVPVKVEDTHVKYGRTQVLYDENKGKFSLKQIELGGTTTRMTFPAASE